MSDREEVISHLQIMHTWADFAMEKDINYFTNYHFMKIVKWMEDALELLKEQEPVVRCKDCKHRPTKPNECISGFDLAFADEVCPCHCDDPYYSWYPPDDWYCANGERR